MIFILLVWSMFMNSGSNHKMMSLSHNNNYLPWNSLNQDYPPSCTSSGSVLQLCSFINICSTVKVELHLKGITDRLIPIYPQNCVCKTYNNSQKDNYRWYTSKKMIFFISLKYINGTHMVNEWVKVIYICTYTGCPSMWMKAGSKKARVFPVPVYNKTISYLS